jgi:hypothetical protein
MNVPEGRREAWLRRGVAALRGIALLRGSLYGTTES